MKTADGIVPEALFLRWIRREPPEPAYTPDFLCDLAGSARSYADERYLRVGGPRSATLLRCARGCDHCCHLPVQTTVAEALQAWRWARESFSSDAFAALVLAAREAGRAYPEYARSGPRSGRVVPCPFLVDGACSVYPVRPLSCRGCNSYDAGACARACREGPAQVRIPVNTAIRTVYANAAEALARGLARAGVEAVVYLAPTLAELAVAGSESEAVARWICAG